MKKEKKIKNHSVCRKCKWKNEKDEVIDIFVQKQPDGKNILAFGKEKTMEIVVNTISTARLRFFLNTQMVYIGHLLSRPDRKANTGRTKDF